MDSLLKYLGLEKHKDESGRSEDDYSKQLDKWLEKNIPRQKTEISLRQKAWDLGVMSFFVLGILYFYKKDIRKFPKKSDQRKYKLFTGASISLLGILLYQRWTDDGLYRPVEVKREPEDTDFDVKKKYWKEKLFPPETRDFYNRYILGKEPESRASTSPDKQKASDSEKSS